MLKLMSASLQKWLGGLFGKKHARIGIYGPPNAGKTTLANRIARDFTGETVGSASPVPHETRRVRKKADIELKSNGARLHIDVIDTPGGDDLAVHGVLLHPEGSVGWHGDFVAPLMPGARVASNVAVNCEG